MSDKSHKLAKVLLVAGGAAVSVFLIAKYRHQIIQKISKTRDKIFYEYAKVSRSSFKVEVINDPNECKNFISRLREQCNEFPVIGFDCEWVTVNNERRKIALIQLCSPQGLCALIRVFKFPKIPLELRQLLEDPEIIKAGVVPTSDANYLLQDYAIMMNGTFDLRFLALLAKHQAEGLGKLSKSILGIELDKNWRVRCSDWEIGTLSPSQIDYAAKDAFVAIEIFRKLYRLIRPETINPEDIRRFCDSYTDIAFKNKLAQLNLDPASESPSNKKLFKGQNNLAKGILSKRAYSSRTTPFYHNCHLEAPDGELLCTCDRKKAEWYVKKGRGIVIEEEPVFTVRLNFEPAGRSVGEVGEYYKCVRENRCVVCGKTQELLRKHVVPTEYRKFLPGFMKSKTSHDVLLMCVHCHQISNISDLKMRQLLQGECDAPLNGMDPVDIESSNKLKREQRLARALFNENSIPEDRKNEMRDSLKKAYPDAEITDEFLKNLLSRQVLTSNIHTPSHGETVVKRYAETGGLVRLEKLWRQHFLDTMKPKFMPDHWDINHNSNRLEIRANEGRIQEEDLKLAGVDVKIVPKTEPLLVVTSPEEKPNQSNFNSDVEGDVDTIDSSSDWDFRSAAGSRNSSSKVDMDRTLTEDERYYSDAASMRSFYETIRSEGSTIDDFQSFASSLTERPLCGSDGSRTSLCSQDLSIDSDTEVEDEQMGKMEL